MNNSYVNGAFKEARFDSEQGMDFTSQQASFNLDRFFWFLS